LQHAQFLAHLDEIAVGFGPEGDIRLDLLQDPGCSVCGARFIRAGGPTMVVAAADKGKVA
jgi:hypothetical protein